MTITGTNLFTATAVKFGPTNAASFTVNNDTSITATSPAGVGTVDVTVTTPVGTSATSAADQFTYSSAPAPTVSGLSPNSGPSGGGTAVTITGTGFSGTMAVSFGTTAATSFTVNNATSISAISPPHVAGTVDVTVLTPGGTSATSAVDQFTYTAVPAPTVTGVSPNNGPRTGGTSVTITGTNLTGASAVRFGSSAASSFTVNSDTSITATSPGSATFGTVDITITTPSGTSATSAADQFTYTAATVTNLFPTSGPAGGGSIVTITGTNLFTATAVKFGATNATSFTVNNDTSITATSPAGTGTVDITVTTPGGTSATSAADKFTYQSAVATLSNLTVSQGTLTPAFAIGTTSYTDAVANGVTSMTVTPTVTDSNATVKVNNTAVTSGSASQAISLAVGANTINVVVTAQDGTTTQTYTITVTRAASSIATLANLTVSQGALSPTFAPGTTGYTDALPNTVTSMMVTPTATDSNATIKVNGVTVTSGSASTAISLAANATTTITIVVTAQDGTTTQTYTIAVTLSIPADSQKVRAIQNAITPMIAQTSGMVMSSAIDGGIADGLDGGGQFLTVGPSGMTFNFAADPDTMRSPQNGGDPNAKINMARANDAFAKALGYDKMPTKAPLSAPAMAKQWSLWLDIRGTGFKTTDASAAPTLGPAADVRGNQLNVTAGLGYKLAPDLLVGIIAGGEFFKYDVTSLNGTLKGNGESVGGYIARRFGNIRIDGAFVYSAMHYDVSSGTASGTFGANRWMGSGGITGNYKWDAFLLEPAAKIYILKEHQKDWTDSLGTMQPSRDFTTGRASAGGKVGRLFEVNGVRWLPYLGLYGDYTFMSDNAVIVGPPVATIHAGWAARATGGVGISAPSGARVSLGGELGGLGAQYKIWTGNVRASLPF